MNGNRFWYELDEENTTLRAQVEELTRALDELRKRTSNLLACKNCEQRAEQAEKESGRLTEAYVAAVNKYEQVEARLARTEACRQAEQDVVKMLHERLAAVVEALDRDNGVSPVVRLAAVSAAAREQPTQEKLPLGHPYTEGRRFHGRINEHDCAAYNHCDECGEPESAHQPTQEPLDRYGDADE